MEETHDLFMVDNKHNLWFTTGTAAGGPSQEIPRAFQLSSLEVPPYSLPGGDAGGAATVTVRLLDSSEFNSHFGFMPLGFNFGAEIKGIVDVHLSEVPVSGQAAGTYTIAAMAGSQNLAAVYPTVLNAAGRWVWTRMDTNAALTPSAITAVPALGFQFVLPISGIPSGTLITGRMTSVSDWVTAGAVGLETDTVTVLAP